MKISIDWLRTLVQQTELGRHLGIGRTNIKSSYANRGFIKWAPVKSWWMTSALSEHRALVVCMVVGPLVIAGCSGPGGIDQVSGERAAAGNLEVGAYRDSTPPDRTPHYQAARYEDNTPVVWAKGKTALAAPPFSLERARVLGSQALLSSSSRSGERQAETQLAGLTTDGYETRVPSGSIKGDTNPAPASLSIEPGWSGYALADHRESTSSSDSFRRSPAGSQAASYRSDAAFRTAPVASTGAEHGARASAGLVPVLPVASLGNVRSLGYQTATPSPRFSDDGKAGIPELKFQSNGKAIGFSAELSGDLKDQTNPWAFKGTQDPVGHFKSAGEWSRRTDIRSAFNFADQVTLSVENSSKDRRELEEEEIGSFFVGHSDKWEEKTVNDTRVVAGFLNDRLRFSTAYSMSNFASNKTEGEVQAGSQYQQGVAFDAWRGDTVEVSFFGAYGEAEKQYKDLSLGGNDKKSKNPFSDSTLFAKPGYSALSYGGQTKVGPGTLSLEQTQSWSEEDKGIFNNAYEAGFSFDINDAAKRAGIELDGAVAAMTPDSLWANYGIARETSETDKSGPDNRSTSFSFGSSWWWEGGYSSISYWSSVLDNLQEGAEDADWSGQGLDFSLGYYQDSWGVDGGFGFNRSDNYGEWSRSWDAGLDTWLSLNYTPDEEYPMVNVSLSTSRWQGDYESSNGESLSDSWSVVSELDFSRSVDDWFGWDPETSSFGFSLAVEGEHQSSEWSGVSDRSSDLDVFIGFTGKVGLYE